MKPDQSAIQAMPTPVQRALAVQRGGTELLTTRRLRQVLEEVLPESYCATSVTTSHVHARTLHCTTPPHPSPPRVAPSPLRTSGSLLHPCADADVRIMFDDVITVLQAAAANNGEGVDIVTIDTGAFFFGASPFFHAFSGDVRYECFKHPVYSKG